MLDFIRWRISQHSEHSSIDACLWEKSITEYFSDKLKQFIGSLDKNDD